MGTSDEDADRDAAPSSADGDPAWSGTVGAGAGIPGPLISVDDLARACRGTNPPLLLDCRWSTDGGAAHEEYRRAHIPGARFVDLDTELSEPPGSGGRHPLPSQRRLGAALARAGLRSGQPVVAYDAADGTIAARAWWLMHWALASPVPASPGSPTGPGPRQVAVLDGGFAEWARQGLPTESGVPDPVTVTEEPHLHPGQMPVLDTAAAAALAAEGVLLDARSHERYTGRQEHLDPVAGHIPGARNLPLGQLHDQRGRWLPPDRLREVLQRQGAGSGSGPVGVYCGSGVTACGLVLAAAVARLEPLPALYPDSWSGWCAQEMPAAAGGATSGDGGAF